VLQPGNVIVELDGTQLNLLRSQRNRIVLLIPRLGVLLRRSLILLGELHNLFAGLPNDINERKDGHRVERGGHRRRHTRQARDERAEMPGKANADLFPKQGHGGFRLVHLRTGFRRELFRVVGGVLECSFEGCSPGDQINVRTGDFGGNGHGNPYA